MSDVKQIEKRDRASQVRPGGPEIGRPVPAYGPLDVQFESAFDRACYVASLPGFNTKNPAKYNALVDALEAQTGCTAEELLQHGEKVRARLWFVVDDLKRRGPVESKTPYALSTTIPAF
jgi:hypothetical protein